MSWTDADRAFMAQAIELATGRMGETWPNPAVGCVIVKDGRVIAQAATAPGGRPHAEEQAVPAAGPDVASGNAKQFATECAGSLQETMPPPKNCQTFNPTRQRLQ